MRFYMRTGRNSGVSVGIVGGLILLVVLAAVWFWIALAIAAVLIVAGIYQLARKAVQRRD